jgi:hypothetical protein
MGSKKKDKEKAEKPLDKWTIKELRDEAAQITEVQGVSGMNKQELLVLVREAKGIPAPKAAKKTQGVREIKKKVAELRKKKDEQRAQGASRKVLDIMRRKISKMKKKTRG